MKENITNKAPEGYVFDKENSDLDNNIVVWKPKPEISYKELKDNMFKIKDMGFFITEIDKDYDVDYRDIINFDNIKKVLAFNKLLNIATYLNKDWKPDWESSTQYKWYIDPKYSNYDNTYLGVDVHFCIDRKPNLVIYFRTENDAERAMEIMGDDINYLFD